MTGYHPLENYIGCKKLHPVMGKNTLSKREKIECLGEALRQEASGTIFQSRTLRLIDAKCLDNIGKKTFYNHLEALELLEFVEASKKGTVTIP